MTEITIPLRSHDEAIQILGPYDRNAKLLRQALDIELYTRGGNLRVKGADPDVGDAQRRIEHLLGKVRKGRALEPKEVERILIGESEGAPPERRASNHPGSGAGHSGGHAGAHDGRGMVAGISTNLWSRPGTAAKRIRAVEPRGANQARYLESINSSTLTFGVGVAGTGKTFLAVAAAVRRLREGECRRLIMTRPVVEAGEHLGFLPGDLQAKLNPFMRPVYDALFDLLGFEETRALEEAGVIEVAPLAYMRGRTLAEAFVILDEAQNTTLSQMKMFLTRLGEGSSMVVTGDPTQSDLEGGQRSGFVDAIRRLRGFAGISVCEFEAKDIVRHPLVQKIVHAYEGSPDRPQRGPERGAR